MLSMLEVMLFYFCRHLYKLTKLSFVSYLKKNIFLISALTSELNVNKKSKIRIKSNGLPRGAAV